MKEAVAFNTEYREEVGKDRIRDEVRAFIGEYRFRFQTYDYPLVFIDGKVRDPHQFEPLEEMGKRAIELRKENGKPVHREEAELKGIRLWQDRLSYGANTIVYASPPGPSEEGYGNYGFIYFGKVEDAKIDMTAIRVNEPKISQFNKFMGGILGGMSLNFSNPDMFLQSPLVITSGLNKENFLKLIEKEFPLKLDDKEEGLKKLASQDSILNKFVDEFVRTKDVRYLYAAENRAIQLRLIFDNKLTELPIPDFEAAFFLLNFQPSKVNGSCGVSSQSNRLFGSFSGVSEVSGNRKEWFVCPKCDYHADGPVGNQCPSCGITKEEFAKQGGAAC